MRPNRFTRVPACRESRHSDSQAELPRLYPAVLMESSVDLHQREMYELAVRIGASWVQIRRGAAMGSLRDYLLGSGDEALEQGQMIRSTCSPASLRGG